MMSEPEIPKTTPQIGAPVPRQRFSGWNRSDPEQQKFFLEKLTERFSVNFEYTALNCLVVILLMVAFISGQLPLAVLALLVAPPLIPIYALGFGINLLSFDFVKKGFIAFISSSLLTFLVAWFAGFIATQLKAEKTFLWDYFVEFSWSNLVILLVGLLFALTIILRNPKQNINVANVALAYVYYLPLSTAGFSVFTSAIPNVWNALFTFIFQFLISVCVSVLILFISGVRAKGIRNLIPILFVSACLIGMYFFLNRGTSAPIVAPKETLEPGAALESTSTATAVIPTSTGVPALIPSEAAPAQNTPSPTIFMQPTNTPTITLTPLSTPVWAEIQAVESNGANVRNEPGYNGKIISTILNGTLVEVLAEVEVVDNNTWVHIRLEDGTEGWIVRSLLVSITPVPDW